MNRVPAGFGDALAAAADAESATAVELGADPRHVAETELLVSRVVATGYARVAAAQGRAPLPVTVDTRAVRSASASRPPSPYAVTFPQGMLWAVLACAATFGIGLIGERSSGTMVRLVVAPASRASVLGGKALACAASIVAMQAVLLAVATLGFGVAPLSWPLLLLAIASVTVGFVGLMMLISVLARRSQSAAGLSWAILMVLAMLGGGMLPLFLMPEWLQVLAHLSPVSWGILALEGAIWRGFDLAAMLRPCAALVVVGVASFTLGARRFQAD